MTAIRNTDGSSWFSDPDQLLDELLRGTSMVREQDTPKIVGYSDWTELARGGQGVVWSAVQESTRRRVAVKLLLDRSLDDRAARRRFEREIDLAVRLRHPHIVRIFDSGTTQDGRPYSVMEFIEGRPLDEFLRQRSASKGRCPAGVDPEVLQLFEKIADALRHAHQRGVIHRDLKPSNVRVDSEAQPHVLDFGLAKIDRLSGDLKAGAAEDASIVTAASGHFVGSLPWASPEQVIGRSSEIDTRTDIYSLGVMLYAALTGSHPYEVSGSTRDVLNTIAGSEPHRPRTLEPRISVDAETVVLRCLAKDCDRRYQSAGELAEELKRLRHGDPVLARSDSSWYLLRRTIKRHRAVATMASILFVGLIVFSITMWVLYAWADRAQTHASQESTRATTVNDFLERMLASANPSVLGREATVREMVDQAARELALDSSLQPLVRASLHRVIGQTYRGLGEYALAIEYFEAAIEIAEEELGPQHERSLQYRVLLVQPLLDLSSFEFASEQADEVLADARQELGEDHRTTLEAWSMVALVKSEQGESKAAIDIHHRVWSARRRTLGDLHPETITSLHNLAGEEGWAGQLEDSRRHFEQANELQMQFYGPDHPETILGMSSLAVTLQNEGKLLRAEEILRDLLPKAIVAWGKDHRETNILKSNLLYSLYSLDKLDEALNLATEILTSTRASLGESHSDTLNAMNGLAVVLHHRDEHEEAARLLSDSYRICLEALGSGHIRTIDSANSLARVLRRLDRLEEADELAALNLQRARRYFGEEQGDLAWNLQTSGLIKLDRQEYVAAIELLKESLQVVEYQSDESFKPDVLRALGRAYAGAGRIDDARETWEACLEVQKRIGASDSHQQAIEQLLQDIAAN